MLSSFRELTRAGMPPFVGVPSALGMLGTLSCGIFELHAQAAKSPRVNEVDAEGKGGGVWAQSRLLRLTPLGSGAYFLKQMHGTKTLRS